MSTSVPFDIAAFGDATDLSIQKIWIKSGEDLKEYHKEYYNTEQTPDYITKDSSLTSQPSYSQIPENGIIPAASPHQGFDRTYTQKFYSSMITITRAEWKYGVSTRKLQSIVNERRQAAVRSKETILAGLFDNMAATSYSETGVGQYSFTVNSAGGDGVSAKSTSHTREDGGTAWNNQITDGTTVNMNFDYAGLKAARKTAQGILGGVGEVLDIKLNKLLCKAESTVHHKAQEILKAIERGENPTTANRDGSITFPYTIVPNPYFANDAYWGMLDSSKLNMKMGYQLKQGAPLTLDAQHIDYKTKEFQWSYGEDFEFGFNDVRNYVFSDGTNA